MIPVIELAKQLIARQSITPNDQGCQALILDILHSAGFESTQIPSNGVSNFFAWHGDGKPSLIFSGHTDVVPPGPLSQWKTEPFGPTEIDGVLYGRGAADMKSALAAMTLAAAGFVTTTKSHPGLIGFAITSDEEGQATDGTIKIIDHLKEQNKIPDYVLVGEASSNHTVGDAIKIGRRGSMHGELVVLGKQGHIAYPEKAKNAIHQCFPALNELANIEWDQGSEHFPPTSLQFYEIKSGIASNVIPATLKAKFNLRFAPVHSTQHLKNEIDKILKRHNLSYTLNYNVSSEPFYSGACQFSQICCDATAAVLGITPEKNTRGGTSDGRHFAPLGCQVVELGAVNKSIHQANEHIDLKQLTQLQQIYERIIALSLVS